MLEIVWDLLMHISVSDKKNDGFERHGIMCRRAHEVMAIKREWKDALINLIALIIVLYITILKWNAI